MADTKEDGIHPMFELEGGIIDSIIEIGAKTV